MFNNSGFKKLALGSCLAFLAIVAVSLGSSQIYLMAIILGFVAPVLWLLGLVLSKGITCERNAPQTCHEGERARVNLTLRNTGLFPKFYLRASDHLPRWVRFAGDDSQQGSLVLQLWPGESEEVGYYLEPQKRGLYRIGPTRVQMSDLIGFNWFSREIAGESEVLVYPQILPVRSDFLSSGISRGWREEDRALTRGSGMDFDSVREYRSGDELRRINWKTTARMGALAVTEYTQGEANDVIIVLDLQREAYKDSGEGKEGALEYGVKIATALAAAALRQGSSMRLLTQASNGEPREPLRGYEHLPVALDELARAEAEYDMPISEVLERAVAGVRPGTTLVCITPVDSEDSALRMALTTWRSAPVSSPLCLFWLQRVEFQKPAGKEKSGSAGSLPLAGYGRTTFGREFYIFPGSSLIQLLQEPSYVRSGL